jgi:hypothetical protein
MTDTPTKKRVIVKKEYKTLAPTNVIPGPTDIQSILDNVKNLISRDITYALHRTSELQPHEAKKIIEYTKVLLAMQKQEHELEQLSKLTDEQLLEEAKKLGLLPEEIEDDSEIKA